MRRDDTRGSLLLMALFVMALLGLLLSWWLSAMHSAIRWAAWETARAQALYLAEAGLSAAQDLLTQGWDAAQESRAFPLRQAIALPRGDQAAPIGEFEVAATPIGPTALRLTATGRVAHGSARIERTLAQVVVRKRKTVFRREGGSGALQLEVEHLDEDGLPDLVRLSGALAPSADGATAGVLSAGNEGARALGYHLMASFTDVDRDGGADLVLSDLPSRAAQQLPGASLATVTLTDAEDARRASSVTTARLVPSHRPIPVMTTGWVVLPEGSLTGAEAGAEVFFNRLVDDGTFPLAWTEVAPASAPSSTQRAR